MANPINPAPMPERSRDQRVAALARANEVRTYRAELKRALKYGQTGWWEPLEEPIAPMLRSMLVADYLRAIPGVGNKKIGDVLRTARIAPRKTLGGLTDRQRRELETHLVNLLPPTANRALPARLAREVVS